MRQVICAAPAIDVAPFARKLAAGGVVVGDPSRALCERFGYQTLYEIPAAHQKSLRRQLIREHIESLRRNPDSVFDHSVFTWLADWMRWLWGETSSEEWESVLAEATPAIDLSERIHHVSGGGPAAYDGYRWLDARNSAQVEVIVRGLYVQFGCEARVVQAERIEP
jgi:hypothetical protein